MVLDDINEPAAINSWWPVSRSGTGWVLATTRMKDARLTGGGRTRVDIDVYTPQEADSYLRTRLGSEDMAHLLDDQIPVLADTLGHLPLGLSHAAAYMINEELTCTAYLNLFAHKQTQLDEALPETADTEGYGRRSPPRSCFPLMPPWPPTPPPSPPPPCAWPRSWILPATLTRSGLPRPSWSTSPATPLPALQTKNPPKRHK